MMSESENDVLKLILNGVNESQKGIAQLNERFSTLETKVGSNYAELKTRLDEGEKSITNLQISAKECDTRFVEQNVKLATIERDIKSLERQVPPILSRQEKFEQDLSGYGKRLNLTEGASKGASNFWGYLVGASGMIFGFVSLLLAFWRLVK